MGGTICLEMVKKMQDAGYVFAEVPVHHYHRAYGRSQFFNWQRLLRVARDLIALWLELVVRGEHIKAWEVKQSEMSEPVSGPVVSELSEG